MSIQTIEKNDFSNYISIMKSSLSLFEKFELPPSKSWSIDWDACTQISNIQSRPTLWNKISFLDELQQQKHNPGVYYFTLETHGEELHRGFLEMKIESLRSRKDKTINKVTYNISHTPKQYNNSMCIYVGSRKKDLHGRLIQHLGFGSNIGTGALYLKHVLAHLNIQPTITFHYHTFDPQFTSLTEHIEHVIQTKLNPFIGKK